MDCGQAKELIVESLYDELPSDSASELQTHLAECESCLKYREELQQGQDVVRPGQRFLFSRDRRHWRSRLLNHDIVG